jgi:hypothetical protein
MSTSTLRVRTFRILASFCRSGMLRSDEGGGDDGREGVVFGDSGGLESSEEGRGSEAALLAIAILHNLHLSGATVEVQHVFHHTPELPGG